MAGCYIGRNADLGVISEWKAQLLKNQNMLSAAHLSSRKCPDFGIHYNGNCSDKITLSKMSWNRHLRHACRLAQFHDHWEAEIKAFMWDKINGEIDVNISSETLHWMVEGASFLLGIVTNLFKVKLYFKRTILPVVKYCKLLSIWHGKTSTYGKWKWKCCAWIINLIRNRSTLLPLVVNSPFVYLIKYV